MDKLAGQSKEKLDALTFTQYKGRTRKPHKLVLPILPVLQTTIDVSPCGDMTYLVNHLERPFTDAGFGNWFRDRCVEAGVTGRAHGLRKAGATIAANNGATAHQLMAIFGWDTLKMAEQYTRSADQRRLAEAAMHMLDTGEQTRTESCPTETPGGTFSAKN
jgi:integrase